MSKFERFRSEAPVFLYRSYNINETVDSVEVSFSFSIPELMDFFFFCVFSKPVDVSVNGFLTFESMAFSLVLADAVRYW